MHRTDDMNQSRTSRTTVLLACMTLLVFALAAAIPASAQVPTVVFSQANGGGGICSTTGQASCDYAGTTGHMAANSRGDVIANVSANGGAYVMEIPINGGTPTTLLTGEGSLYEGHAAFVDKSNNIWITDTGDATIVFIPFVNGSYPANVAYSSSMTTCAFPVPANQTATCIVQLNYPGSIGGYGQGADLGLDGAGNLYVLFKYVGSGSAYAGSDVVVKFLASTGVGTAVSPALSNDAAGEIAVNSAGDYFVETYGSVSEYAHTNYTAALSVFSLNGPDGLSVDANGNLFITNNTAGNILECPYANNTYNMPTSCPIVSNQLSTGYSSVPSQGIAIDGLGRITMAGNYPNSYSTLTVGHAAFGATPINTTSAAQTLNLVFNSAKTFGSFKVTGPFAVSTTGLPSGDTACAAGSYAVGGNCSIEVTYSSSAAGTQLGQLSAYDNAGNLLGSAVLSGIGTAATINADPGTNVADGTGFTAPSAVTTDNAGHIYVSDSSTGNIYMTSTGSTAAATVVASGFSKPSAVAVDGNGNLYVADTGNSQIVEVPYSATTSTYGAHTSLITGLSGPSGLALDEFGDIYVADSGNSRVLRLASSGNMPVGTLITTVGSGFTTPVAVAVDNTNNNVYVSDAGTKTIVQVNLITSSQVSVITGMTLPAGVAVDPAGDVFAVDSGKATITRLPFISGGINPNFKITLATVVNLPTAIASDDAGNLYVADTTDQAVETDQRSIGLLGFGNITEGQSSSTVAGQLSNGGTASLTLSSPYYTQAGATSSFAIQSSSTCTAAGTLTTGQSCTVAAVFTPQSYGILTDTLTLASTAPNSATLALSGNGTPVAIKTTLNLAVTSSGTPTFGQPVTITATLVAASQAASPPSGTVTFLVDSVTQQPASNLNSATGTASITLTGLTGGKHTITASYSGDNAGFYSSTSASALTVTVATVTTTTTVSVTAPDSNPTAANPSTTANVQTVTLTAFVTPLFSGTPTGTVTFYSGTTVLGTASVVAYTAVSNGPSEGEAILSVNTPTNPLPLAQYQVTATYNGDTNYSGSSSSTAIPLLIANPTILLTPSATTVTGGGSAITVTVSSIAGFSAAVNFSCGGLPQYAACSFGPPYASVGPSNPAPTLFQVVINQPPVIAVPAGIGTLPKGRGTLTTLFAVLFLLPVVVLAYARRANGNALSLLSTMRLHSVIGLLLIGGCAALIGGCSTASSGNFTTPAGTSTITFNAITTVAGQTNPPAAASIQLQLIVP